MLILISFRMWDGTVVDVANDRKWGVYALLRMNGGSGSAYVCSIVISNIVFWFLQLALLGLSLAATSGLGMLTLASMTLIAFITSISWICIGIAVGALVNSYSMRDLVTRLTALPVLLSAPLFYRLDRAPGYLRYISDVNPLTYEVSWLRDAGGQGLLSITVLKPALVCGLAFLLAVWSVDRVVWLSNER